MSEKIPEQKIVDLLKRLIRSGTPKQYLLFFEKYHEADIAEILETFNPEEKQKFFLNVKPEIAAEILEEMSMTEQVSLISELKVNLAAKFIEEMDPDDAVDLLEELQESDEHKAEEIIEALPQEEAKELKTLLSYEEDTAGAIMTSEYVALPEKLKVNQAIESIKANEPPDSEVSFYIYIINEANILKGYTTLRNLILANPDQQVKSIRNDYPITAHVNDDQEEVAKLFQKYNLITLPVVDDKKQLLGLITVDDVVDVVIEEATEDIYKLSGTSDIDEEKLVSGSIINSLISRSPWLIITIGGGLLASYIITTYSGLYEPRLFSLALSLSFIPMLMGLGGNVGNQSATIIVRGLSTGVIKDTQPLKTILRESNIGFLMGCLIGGIVLIFNIFLTQNSFLFSCIVSLALLLNILTASVIGSTLPIVFNKLNIDPAVASAPFISTALDIIGQLIYFALTLSIISTFG